jgi:serine phosphatase RsbU (regulator of sigma subunit)
MAGSLRIFWQRVSEGIQIQELWAQFRTEARASYELYSQEVAWTRAEGESRGRRVRRVAKGLFWAMMMKLSPGRRILLLFALILLVFPGIDIHSPNFEFSMPNLAFFGGLALVVLLALELADRVTMKRDLQIAREIQGWLMPSAPPVVPGVDIAFATRPANTVAGDYYDAFLRQIVLHPAPDTVAAQNRERLLVVVGDVAGKSVPAALLMATLQASLRTLATLPLSLPELVDRLNQYVCAQNLGGRRFITAFLGELELSTRRLTYVNAGHNWPVLRRVSGSIERLEAGGLPLGISAAAQYECCDTTLGAGDVLLVFTDGVIEAENDKEEEYGEGRMLGIVHGFLGRTAAQALGWLMASVDAFVGSARQHDDITCLVLRTFVPTPGA